MRKVDKLALAAAVAPVLRETPEATKVRKVALVDKAGNVVGYTTGEEVLKGLAERISIEHAVQDGTRPKTVTCRNCGATTVNRSTGRVRTVCGDGCKCGRDGCNRKVSVGSVCAGLKRGKRAWCAECSRSEEGRARSNEARRRAFERETPEQREARLKARRAAARKMLEKRALKPRKTHCKRGHLKTPGKSYCVECANAARRKGKKVWTHCKRGHALIPENRYPSGDCRLCERARRGKKKA